MNTIQKRTLRVLVERLRLQESLSTWCGHSHGSLRRAVRIPVGMVGNHAAASDNNHHDHNRRSTARLTHSWTNRTSHRIPPRSSPNYLNLSHSCSVKRNVNNRHYSESDNNGEKNISTLFIPVPVKVTFNPDDINIGEELGASLKDKKAELLKVLNSFYRRKEIQRLAAENGLDELLFHQAFVSFRKYIVEVECLEPDLHIVLSDILAGAGHVDDIFPYFLRHARQVFPALDCMDDLRKISDLTDPAQWYPDARAIKRKIVFHAGPTNSGKTYHALESFCSAKSGVYCGPLKLLANEVHMKTNDKGIMCDLVTGEERRYTHPEGIPASHVACTVEMTNVNQPCRKQRNCQKSTQSRTSNLECKRLSA